MILSRSACLLSVIAWGAAGLPLPVRACQICLPIPTRSAADFLIEADAVVLARENPDKPFSLKAVEVLKGEISSTEIDLFLDSQTRRLLALHPGRRVVCVHRAPDPDAGWRRIGVANEVLDPIVREILGRSADWAANPGERPAYFARFLGHEDAQLRTLAHLEVARAPYDEIRKLGGALPPGEIRVFLENYRYIEWHALYILLLAQSGEKVDRERIVGSIESAARFSLSTQLAAWATAFIEIEEDTALDFLEERYFRDPGRSLDEMRALQAALSVHGARGHTHLRGRIAELYRLLLGSRPEMAPRIAADLMLWEHWGLGDAVAGIAASPPESIEFGEIVQLRAYARLAREARVPPVVAHHSRESSPGTPVFVIVVVVLCLVPVVLGMHRRRRG